MANTRSPRPIRPKPNILLEVINFLEPQAKSVQQAETSALRARFISQQNDETFEHFIQTVDRIAVMRPVIGALALHHAAREFAKSGEYRNRVFEKMGDVLELVACRQKYDEYSGNLVALGLAVLGAFEARGLRDQERLSVCCEQVNKYRQLVANEGNIEVTLSVLTSVSIIDFKVPSNSQLALT